MQVLRFEFLKFRILEILNFRPLNYAYCISGSGDDTDGGALLSAAKDFNTEYAKSGKSMCRSCDNHIEKVRIRQPYFEGSGSVVESVT